MNAVLLTGWAGTTFAKMACWTLPLLEAYAGRHGMRFCCFNLAGSRPPSWMKVLMIHQALQDFDAVAWIDADVVVMDPRESILAQLAPNSWQGLVEHDTSSGIVPNCGVWICTQGMLPTLTEIWNEGKHLEHPWWEQAAILERMGYVVTDKPTATLGQASELHARTTFLPATWNHHPHDARRVDSPRFVHVTQYVDRPAECRRLAEIAAQSDAWRQQ